MAIQSSFYVVDGSTRTFPSTKPIATKQHCAVYVKSATLLTWSSVTTGDYSLINNSIVFDTAPSSVLYSQIEIRVVDTQDEIVDSPSDISLVADSIANVNIDAANINSINTVATNIGSVTTTSGSIANVNTVAANIVNVNLAGGNTANINAVVANASNVTAVGLDLLEPTSEINTVATSIANVNTVGLAIANVNTVATSIANVNTTATNIANVNTVAGISGNVTTVAGISTNVTTVANNNTNVTTVANNIANVNTVGGISANITTVAGISTNVTSVAGNATDISSVATTIVPNLEILLADTNAATATTKASEAAASALSASNSAAQAAQIVTAPLLMSYGNLSSLLLDMPLKNSLAMKSGVGSATFTRASTATYIDRYGVLKTSAIDEPRFEKEGYLNEGASTNLLTYSEQFDNAIWAKGNATITANTTDTIDPYGTNLAEKIVDSTATSTHYFTQTASVVAGTSYTLSIFVKKKDTRCIRISFGTLNGTFAGESVTFDPSDGTYSLTVGTPSVKVDSFSNGWYRVSVTATALVTDTAQLFFYITLDKVSSTSYLGDGTSGLYIFGAQLEASPVATSYIPTAASTVTRAADTEKNTRYGNAPSLAGDFTVLLDAKALIGIVATTTGRYIFTIGTAPSALLIYQHSSGAFTVAYGSQTMLFSTAYPLTQKTRIGVTKSGTTFKIYINGVLISTGTITTQITTNDVSFNIGMASNSTTQFYGSLSNVRMYDFALTAQEMALA